MERTMPRNTGIIRELPDFSKLLPDFSEVNGGSGQDVLHAAPAWFGSHIHAGADDDLVIGGDGNDTIWGQDGSDNLLGGGGNDTIYGDDGPETGNDFIAGGAGADTMYGGLGADSFVWFDISETGVSAGFGGDKDVIGDFNPGQGDHINLAPLRNNAGLSNPLTFVDFHHQDGFTAAGQVGWDTDFNGNINIWINTDSDPQAEAGISVQFIGFQPDAGWFNF
jgi:Ca2+-binding RTX toxin-like protein